MYKFSIAFKIIALYIELLSCYLFYLILDKFQLEKCNLFDFLEYENILSNQFSSIYYLVKKMLITYLPVFMKIFEIII